jgi:hypothetical protein
MKKRIVVVGILLTLLQGCVPNIVVDSKGRSGTFDKSRADEITDDKFTCIDIVKDNVNLPFDYITYGVSKYFEFATLGIVKGKSELKSKTYNRNCLKGRGHATIN